MSAGPRPEPDGVLDLVRAAPGCSTAQIDAAVRVARPIYRSQRRALQLDDVRRAFALPLQNDALGWRIALHEAGRAIGCCGIGLGKVSKDHADATRRLNRAQPALA